MAKKQYYYAINNQSIINTIDNVGNNKLIIGMYSSSSVLTTLLYSMTLEKLVNITIHKP